MKCGKRFRIENKHSSPSMRREWIEIRKQKAIRIVQSRLPPCGGSGLKLDVPTDNVRVSSRLPPCGGSGLKYFVLSKTLNCLMSPSMRREWIEMSVLPKKIEWNFESPSMRREWIEILHFSVCITSSPSPSMRREWIEISQHFWMSRQIMCLPPCGGSGLKCGKQRRLTGCSERLPPCGGSGLKFRSG